MLLINDDCMEVIRRLRPNAIKALFADIPDNLGLKYSSHFDSRTSDDYYGWIWRFLMESMRVSGGLVWLSYYPTHDMEIKWMLRDIIRQWRPSWSAAQFIWRFTFGQYRDRDCALGYRPILRLSRSGTDIYPDAIREVSARQLIGDARAAGYRVPDNVWSIPRVVGNSPERRAWHPTQHPASLMKRIIDFSINADSETFMDCCVGTGTSFRAGRNARIIGVEKDLDYCTHIIEEHKGVQLVTLGEAVEDRTLFI